MAVFGCNYEGDIEQENVIRLLRVAVDAAADRGEKITSIQLCDTMGWANPQSIKRMVGGVREAWPDAKINLHLHDTRGMAIANAFAALELGVDEFDAAVGGLGGCPYGEFKGAAGNIVTEDFVHLCEEIGIETGIDLERLLAVSREAQTIFGHPLPSKTISGGALNPTAPPAAPHRRAPISRTAELRCRARAGFPLLTEFARRWIVQESGCRHTDPRALEQVGAL